MVVMAHAARGKMVALPWTFNLFTGRESIQQMGFSDASWGKTTHSYAKSACTLSRVKFGTIVQEAQVFVKPTHTHSRTTSAAETINIDEDDVRACLVNHSNLDEECKLFSFFSST
jgi:hypothetical protein